MSEVPSVHPALTGDDGLGRSGSGPDFPNSEDVFSGATVLFSDVTADGTSPADVSDTPRSPPVCAGKSPGGLIWFDAPHPNRLPAPAKRTW